MTLVLGELTLQVTTQPHSAIFDGDQRDDESNEAEFVRDVSGILTSGDEKIASIEATILRYGALSDLEIEPFDMFDNDDPEVAHAAEFIAFLERWDEKRENVHETFYYQFDCVPGTGSALLITAVDATTLDDLAVSMLVARFTEQFDVSVVLVSADEPFAPKLRAVLKTFKPNEMYLVHSLAQRWPKIDPRSVS